MSLPAADAGARREVPDPNELAVSSGEEEARVRGQRDPRDGLGVAVDGLPYGGGVSGRHHAQLAATGAREERLGVALALAPGGAPDGERPARVELLQRAVAAVVLLGPLRQSHGVARRRRGSSELGFCGGGGARRGRRV